MQVGEVVGQNAALGVLVGAAGFPPCATSWRFAGGVALEDGGDSGGDVVPIGPGSPLGAGGGQRLGRIGSHFVSPGCGMVGRPRRGSLGSGAAGRCSSPERGDRCDCRPVGAPTVQQSGARAGWAALVPVAGRDRSRTDGGSVGCARAVSWRSAGWCDQRWGTAQLGGGGVGPAPAVVSVAVSVRVSVAACAGVGPLSC